MDGCTFRLFLSCVPVPSYRLQMLRSSTVAACRPPHTRYGGDPRLLAKLDRCPTGPRLGAVGGQRRGGHPIDIIKHGLLGLDSIQNVSIWLAIYVKSNQEFRGRFFWGDCGIK